MGGIAKGIGSLLGISGGSSSPPPDQNPVLQDTGPSDEQIKAEAQAEKLRDAQREAAALDAAARRNKRRQGRQSLVNPGLNIPGVTSQ